MLQALVNIVLWPACLEAENLHLLLMVKVESAQLQIVRVE